MNADQALPPGSNRIVDLSGYPGGTNSLSDRDFLYEGINKTIQRSPNTSVNITARSDVYSDSLDGSVYGTAESVNASMIAFCDNSKFGKPVIMSVGEVNKMIYNRTLKMNQNSDRKVDHKNFFNDSVKSRDGIFERFKILGVVANSDEGKRKNGNFSFGTEKRTFTITVDGDCHLYDYWTCKNKEFKQLCLPYTKCYFVLKLVTMRECEYFVTKTSATAMGVDRTNSSLFWKYDENNKLVTDANGNAENMYPPKQVWQFVPFCVQDRTLLGDGKFTNAADFSVQNNGTKVPNIIYQIGYVHEYAVIDKNENYERRFNRHSVTKDVSILTRQGQSKPFQFYLHLKTYHL